MLGHTFAILLIGSTKSSDEPIIFFSLVSKIATDLVDFEFSSIEYSSYGK